MPCFDIFFKNPESGYTKIYSDRIFKIESDEHKIGQKIFYFKLPKVLSEQELIDGCLNGDRRAQKALYDKYASKMFGVCKRYVKTLENAEEVMVEAFCKVFQKIDLYSGQGSFEGWIRRVVVNEALMFLRKNYRFNEHIDITEVPVQAVHVTVEDELSANEIMQLLDQLPTGYRTVFNLYVLEGFKHKEIAEMLDISINTSKSQLILAKKRLKDLVEQAAVIRTGGAETS